MRLAGSALTCQGAILAAQLQYQDLEVWRANFKGVSHIDEVTHLELFGAVDDIWQDESTGELIVVDYKATSKAGEVTIDADWQIAYKRQMEFYQWLLRSNGFATSDTGYFVYCNAPRDRERFDARLEFRIKLIPYTGSDTWVESTVSAIHQILGSSEIPERSKDCKYCLYISDAGAAGT
jgi:hypothetical protein